jgi:ubiquinone/menaquinone biosynthesis C-methylase UbiE
MSKRFDTKAQELDEHPIMREIALEFSRMLSVHVPLSQRFRVLDYGCGSGLIGMHLYSNVGSLTMMDSSEGMLDILNEKIEKEHISNMKVMNCALEESKIESSTFDLIYMNNVLHHIENATSFLKSIKNLLKPNGHLCIGDFEKEDGSFHEDNSDVHSFGFDEHEIDEYCIECGLEKITRKRYYTIKKPNQSGVIQEYPLFFVTTIKA